MTPVSSFLAIEARERIFSICFVFVFPIVVIITPQNKISTGGGNTADNNRNSFHACALLKSFLRSHSGFDRDELQGYLDLFAVIMNPPANPLKKLPVTFKCDRKLPITGTEAE